jgi:hypothetical protein
MPKIYVKNLLELSFLRREIEKNPCFQIWSSRGVVTKLMRVVDKNMDDTTTVEDFMFFIIIITNPS